MMEANEAMKAMARRVCAGLDPNKAYQYLDGSRDDYPTMQAALAAIMETQRLDAELVAGWPAKVLDCEPALFCDGSRWTATHVASRIRAGEHYAAIGEPEGALRNPDA